MEKNEDRYFYSTSFSLACFLYSKGMQMSAPRELNRKQKEFTWVKTLELESLIDIYKFGLKTEEELLINVRDYEQARRELLEIVNN